MWCRHAIVLKSASGQHKFINSKGSENGYLLMGWLFVLTRFLSSFSIIDSGSGSGLILFPSPILPFSDIRRYPSLGLDFPSSTWSSLSLHYLQNIAFPDCRIIKNACDNSVGIYLLLSWACQTCQLTESLRPVNASRISSPQWYDYCDWRMSSLQK